MQINKHILSNGLKLVHCKDTSTAMVAVDVLYNVGAKDENPNKTGLAHLMEHLMFTGSQNVESFDNNMQLAGGINNAWTNNDMTNFYESLPADNLETALWLEADRMNALSLMQESFDVQQKVVMEEFKQNYLNKPYGDFPVLIHNMAYKVHPYNWCTIGKNINHIQSISLNDIKDFYKTYYVPNNAVLSVVGNVDFHEVLCLVEKWFCDIPKKNIVRKSYKQEPKQTEERCVKVQKNVPSTTIAKVFKMPGVINSDYVVCDLISDLLSNGKSSRMFISLAKQNRFVDVDASISGYVEPGLFNVYYYTNEKGGGKSLMDDADSFLKKEVDRLINENIEEKELEKVKNKYESENLFGNMDYVNKAYKLAYFELIKDADLINKEVEKYRAVSDDDIKRVSKILFENNNCSTLFYEAI